MSFLESILPHCFPKWGGCGLTWSFVIVGFLSESLLWASGVFSLCLRPHNWPGLGFLPVSSPFVWSPWACCLLGLDPGELRAGHVAASTLIPGRFCTHSPCDPHSTLKRKTFTCHLQSPSEWVAFFLFFFETESWVLGWLRKTLDLQSSCLYFPSSAIQVCFEGCKLNNPISLNGLFFFLTYWPARFKCEDSQQTVVICVYILHNPFSEPQFLLDFLFSIRSSKALSRLHVGGWATW